MFEVPAELAGRLARLGREAGATPFMTFLAAFVVLLARYTGNDDLVVGAPVAGRTHPDTEQLVGFFVNTLALRTSVRRNPSFRELLGRVRRTCLDAYAHQELPFERLIEALQPGRDTSRNPLFQIMFEYGPGTLGPAGPVAGGLSAEPMWEDTPWHTAKFDLTLGLADRADGSLLGYVEYATDLFDAATVERLAAHYLRVVEAAAVGPGIPLSQLELLTTAERQRLLDGPRMPPGAVPPAGSCVPEAFAARAAATPGAPAVVQGEVTLSYAELARRANTLASELRTRGVRAEVPVAVCARRGLGVVVALLAILQAGGVYLPIDPDAPAGRRQSLADSAGALLLLTEEDLAPLASHAGPPAAVPAAGLSPANLAYVIHTSGSTGTPKGVMIDHRAFLHHCRVIAGSYRIRPGDRVALLSSLAFDVAMDQMMATLLAGATVVVAEPGLSEASGLLGWLAAERVTHLEITPAHYREMMAAVAPGDPRLAALRLMNVGSDVVTYDDARRWHAAGQPGSFLCNYGPTECTVTCMLHWVDRAEAAAGRPEQSVPIGRPVAGARAYILDSALNLTLPGTPGELYLGGTRLARGYLGRPGLTAGQFVPDPFGGEPGGRLYRTGDLARYRANGEIEFLGRLDTQVKIRGFRIELGEIEVTLAGHPCVRAAVVAARRDVGEPELAAYVVLKEHVDMHALRDHLAERLPGYMIPAYWTVLDGLPLTSSGKVNRRELPDPVRLHADYVPPATPVEQQIAAIWAEVIGCDAATIGRHDDFFAVGGHSLRATRVHARIREQFAAGLPLRVLFDATTVQSQAAAVARAVETEIEALSDEDVAALLARLEEET
jgi:amino acid adenylation domain-containing protein